VKSGSVIFILSVIRVPLENVLVCPWLHLSQNTVWRRLKKTYRFWQW